MIQKIAPRDSHHSRITWCSKSVKKDQGETPTVDGNKKSQGGNPPDMYGFPIVNTGISTT